ncbi:hypothetical protein ABXJ76_04580 [Methylobacter sp. G7]|uniref:hypothetical protein n=1 Tax=Methylobacter sp. G7 TaxID=3230117 RepID=UPI003D804ADF
MNILWIEDFGGALPTGTGTLSSMFLDLISFDNWDEDELSLLSRPNDLENFCKENSVLHCVFLCRHYFDYAEFKVNNELAKRIDAVIIDIRLDNNVDFSLPIPSRSHTTAKFHEEAGFYIFNDLVHLGIPAEKMCFMTGEKNSFSGFKKQCDDIYIPEVVGFEKSDAEYGKLRQWIKERESDYAILRRGIIEGCNFLKSHIEKDDGNIQFRDFIKIENNQPVIEIPRTDIKNYLDALSQFLAVKQPNDPFAANIQYRLFLRTLVHEWEENIDPNSFKEKHGNDLSKIRDIYTFAWIMKMTRNWVSHANLLEPLNPQIIGFLFLVNMRAMFKLPKAIQPYERILLRCVSLSPCNAINSQTLNGDINYAEQNIDGVLAALNINESGHFGSKVNSIYRQNTGNPDAEDHDFKGFLLQYFWVNQKPDLRSLTVASNDFLPTLARHIYSRSFLQN